MSLTPDNDCRLCGHPELKEALSLPNSPRNIQRLLRPEELAQDKPISLKVHQCGRCGFVQIRPLLEEAYYDDYVMTTSHSKQMQEYQRQQAQEFVREHRLEGRLVREMGCGDGSFLDHLKAAGALVSGIEPSRPFRELALKRGYQVEGGYVTASRELDCGPFDAFVTRQVLEHVPDIHDFLGGIHRNLKPEAVGLVEVPSLEKALQDRRYYDFFADHVNYFSMPTLRLALELNGFDVLSVRQDMFDEYNVAVVRKREQPSLSEISTTVETLGRELRALIEEERNAGRKVALWGAGGKGLSVMAAAGIDSVDLLVDGDPHKQGLSTPVSHLRVESPKTLVGAGVSVVVITAMAYRREIERVLRQELGFEGRVMVLGHHLVASDA